MDSNLLFNQAVRTIRRELLIKEEPLKAYKLLKELSLPELKEELDKSYGTVRHIFEPAVYEEIYKDDTCVDYDKIEPEKMALQAGQIQLRFAWVLDKIKEEKAKSLLDLGCYVGSMVLTAANSLGIKATGVDCTNKAIDVAKDRAKRLNVSAEFFVGNANDFNQVKADAVVAFEIVEHVKDPEEFINHLCSLTYPGGWVYISTPNGPYDNGRGNLGHWEWDGKGVRGHVRAFVKETMAELLDKCQCEVRYLEGHIDGLLYAQFRKHENLKEAS